jgi:hypothetical protein
MDALELAAENGHTSCALKLIDLGIQVQCRIIILFNYSLYKNIYQFKQIDMG